MMMHQTTTMTMTTRGGYRRASTVAQLMMMLLVASSFLLVLPNVFMAMTTSHHTSINLFHTAEEWDTAPVLANNNKDKDKDNERIIIRRQETNNNGTITEPSSSSSSSVTTTSTMKDHQQQHHHHQQQSYYTMNVQLKEHATTRDGFVLVTAVNYAYREHLINFICTLKRVGMYHHFVIVAMDVTVYEWGMKLNLPIFLVNNNSNSSNSTLLLQQGGTFGSESFEAVTKLKAVAALQILEAGYSIVWSDVDIMWFVHPFEALAEYMNATTSITIQSDAPLKQRTNKRGRPHRTVNYVQSEYPSGVRGRLNSGLYVAPSTELVRGAFREIVTHVYSDDSGKDSEQPSFDEILCHRYPSERRNTSCTYRPNTSTTAASMSGTAETTSSASTSSIHVTVLDRYMFPNGAVLVGRQNQNVFDIGRQGFMNATGTGTLYCAHNNWIAGSHEKKQRAMTAGWWFVVENENDDHNTTSILTCRRE